MKIIIAGGTGQVGTLLAREFQTDGHEVVVLSRRPEQAAWRTVAWDAQSVGDWAKEVDGAEVVINLAGRNVNCRYTEANRRDIMESRVKSTQAVGQAIARAATPPKVWLQMSTATIYAHRYDAPNDEFTGIIGGAEPDAPESWRFSISVAQAWEKAVDDAPTPHTRKVKMRTAVVMSPDADGPFDILLNLVRHGLGGTAYDGRQFISWLHDADLVRAVRWLIEHPQMSDVVNLAAPEPLSNAEFMRVLRDAWGIRLGIPAPKFVLSVAALAMQTETELILKSRRVVPRKLLDDGFEFQFPQWPNAARDLCQRWRKRQETA